MGIGGEPRLKHHGLVVEIEVHGGIVHTGGLMDVDIQAVVGLHLQGRLHAGFREHRHRRVAPVDGLVELCADAGEACLLCFLLLCVIVAGQPPCGVVAGHGKLGVLLLDDKIVQLVLLWKLIAQSHAIVVHPETDDDVALGGRLVEHNFQFVIVVADGGGFTPYGSPCLVKRGGVGSRYLETVHQVGLISLA